MSEKAAGMKEMIATVKGQFPELSAAKSKEIIGAVCTAIVGLANTTPKGVNLHGFGVFRYKETKERTGRNPKTGESILIPAKRKFTFKKSKGI